LFPNWAGKLFGCCWKATSSSRGGKKMWCLPQIDATYLGRMEEDVPVVVEGW
jgi:hypothetical protein